MHTDNGLIPQRLQFTDHAFAVIGGENQVVVTNQSVAWLIRGVDPEELAGVTDVAICI